ncbi:hypothetical protein V6N12_050521 [Hibiscus sabdariffa]|uniref:Uncharacterized protein n=1 Tax=Hibiscus sabdariffa TaxID=183260 RepID=A0ABR2GCL9_9ROSI
MNIMEVTLVIAAIPTAAIRSFASSSVEQHGSVDQQPSPAATPENEPTTLEAENEPAQQPAEQPVQQIDIAQQLNRMEARRIQFMAYT